MENNIKVLDYTSDLMDIMNEVLNDEITDGEAQDLIMAKVKEILEENNAN